MTVKKVPASPEVTSEDDDSNESSELREDEEEEEEDDDVITFEPHCVLCKREESDQCVLNEEHVIRREPVVKDFQRWFTGYDGQFGFVCNDCHKQAIDNSKRERTNITSSPSTSSSESTKLSVSGVQTSPGASSSPPLLECRCCGSNFDSNKRYAYTSFAEAYSSLFPEALLRTNLLYVCERCYRKTARARKKEEAQKKDHTEEVDSSKMKKEKQKQKKKQAKEKEIQKEDKRKEKKQKLKEKEKAKEKEEKAKSKKKVTKKSKEVLANQPEKEKSVGEKRKRVDKSPSIDTFFSKRQKTSVENHTDSKPNEAAAQVIDVDEDMQINQTPVVANCVTDPTPTPATSSVSIIPTVDQSIQQQQQQQHEEQQQHPADQPVDVHPVVHSDEHDNRNTEQHVGEPSNIQETIVSVFIEFRILNRMYEELQLSTEGYFSAQCYTIDRVLRSTMSSTILLADLKQRLQQLTDRTFSQRCSVVSVRRIERDYNGAEIQESLQANNIFRQYPIFPKERFLVYIIQNK